MDVFLPVIFLIGFLLVVGLTTFSARRRLRAALPEGDEGAAREPFDASVEEPRSSAVSRRHGV